MEVLMSKAQTRCKNPNWRGGRTITEHGYVLIRVGTEHSLADVRGYAYEHRVVAERKLGRILADGEIVHHLNGNRQDNRPENIVVVDSIAHHSRKHANRDDLRPLGTENPMVECACGCGKTFPKYDRWNRPRSFVSGHNMKLTGVSNG